MAGAAQEIAYPGFNLAEEIGLPFPQAGEIFLGASQPEKPFDELARSDEFRTRVVLHEPIGEYDQDFLRYIYGMLSALDGQINSQPDSIKSVEERPEAGFRVFGRC